MKKHRTVSANDLGNNCTSWRSQQHKSSIQWQSCGIVSAVLTSKDKVLCLKRKNRRSNDFSRQSMGVEKEIISPGDGKPCRRRDLEECIGILNTNILPLSRYVQAKLLKFHDHDSEAYSY